MSRFLVVISCVVILSCIAALTTAKPIMVTFGTNKGPIVPRSALPSTPITERSDTPTKPAPVYEVREDTPNPETYKPLVPHQYRTKLLALKPSNLILGTPLDVKYTPSEEKYEVYKKTQLKSLGRTYVGPNLFERQAYEFFDFDKGKTFLQPSVSYIKPQVFADKQKYVPEIGVLYSSGVRYYVPQIFYQVVPDEHQTEIAEEQDQENSVYDKQDHKYFYTTS
ncbi:uncharacterized protein LOC123312482 [Coccinella septempunctata]|uniref:uncharacterized protein LOC123312482 n=1 Tax=Coccinella septempunctata TaxID=41139 RepID=UPI001D080AA4|nr:uncharacterized protein LOC123312482 [Coccinella septempunctata]